MSANSKHASGGASPLLRRWPLEASVFGLLVAATLALAAGPVSAIRLPMVASVEARLFLNYSGTLSKPITAKTILWNAIIGEGNIPEPSNSTFVDVLVEGEPGSFTPDLRVELAVSDSSNGKVLQTQVNDVGTFNASGKYHVGFWIPKSGCQPLRMRSRIVGSKTFKTINVPFSCGE